MMRDPVDMLRDAPVDAARLAEVRRRVLARIGAGRPGPGRWVLAGAVVGALLAVLLWPERLELEPPVVAWSAPGPPEGALERERAADHGLRPVARLRAVEPQPEPEITVVDVTEETAMLQIPTSNPDVVLYWLVDGGGD